MIYYADASHQQEFLRQKTSTSEVHTAVQVTKPSINIQIKVPEPKAFDGKKKEANYWPK